MAALIDAGHDVCFAALLRNQLLSYGWYALSSAEPEHTAGVCLSYPRSVAYAYKAFTRPEFRGRGLHAAIIGKSLQRLRMRGLRHVVSLTPITNWPCLRSCERMGYRPIGYLVQLRLGTHHFFFVSRAARKYGVDFAAHLPVAHRGGWDAQAAWTSRVALNK
jgi:GNAT superfamily N-acetyltransferase